MGIGRVKLRVVPIGKRPTTGFHRSMSVITDGFELPDLADAFEVADVGTIQIHAVDIGIKGGQCEVVHTVILCFQSVFGL